MTHPKPTVSGRKVTFIINKNALALVCGVAISSNPQTVYLKILDSNNTQIVAVDGVKFELDLEGTNETLFTNPSDEKIGGVYGPFDQETKLELEFSHGRTEEEEEKGKIITSKMKALIDEDETTRVDMIPYDNGYTEGKDVTDTLATVVRWSR
ncbi:hypothetical protein BYT27DRAFT_7076383 [Phlegmacium glaucopus]|nr:hypothetical protein BYT27DRAFT_7076383 [Phlegmacium glaucopus]